MLPDGSVVRPDLLLIDDAQDPKRADSPAFVADVVETIEKQWMCLAGPQSRITTMMACTVAAADDVSEHFLNRPDFKAVRVARVVSWPDGWDKEDGRARGLWDEWHGILIDGGDVAARRFYRAHKKEMTAGMAVSWKHRMDVKRKDPDAMYAAMFDLYRIGPAAFASEYQNQPIKQGVTLYNLTPEIVCSRTDKDRQPGIVPPTVAQIIAAVDVNPSYGLTWGAVGFAPQVGFVLDYGRTPVRCPADMPEQESARLIYESLTGTFRALAAKPYSVNLILFDVRGWNYEAAYNLSAQAGRITGVPTIGAMGFGAKNYKPGFKSAGRRGNFWHTVIDAKRRQYLSYCSDFWREIAQKSWLGPLGAPGSCSLPAGQHREIAEQICREPLKWKEETPLGLRWEYITMPGAHDFGDVMHMAYLGADYQGMGTGGVMVAVPRKTYQRTVRHIAI